MDAFPSNAVEILLVDDSPACVRLMRLCLEEGEPDSHLSVAGDGADAHDFLHRVGDHSDAPRPDLILLDLEMPRKNGWELLAEIKSDPKLKCIPVIVLSQSDSQRNVDRAYQLHANCYLHKPMDLGQLCEQIRVVKRFWFGMVLRPSGSVLSEHS